MVRWTQLCSQQSRTSIGGMLTCMSMDAYMHLPACPYAICPASAHLLA